jgi:transcriptional regulator with XRE-family HTH domain
MAAMPSRANPLHEASRLAIWLLHELGRELRIARITSGMTQTQVAAKIGSSASTVCRVEHGSVKTLSVPNLSRHAAAVGLKLYANLYPAGRRPLDAPQLGIMATFNARLHAIWKRQVEVPVPLPGDLRAVDEVISKPGCRCAVEIVTRFADVQGQTRGFRAKQRDIGADRLIVVVKGSRANRRMLHEVGPALRDAFPIGTREAMAALAAGQDPGGDCLVIL